MLTVVVEAVGGVLFEIVVQILGEALVSLGITSAENALGLKREPNPILAGLGSVLLGAGVGALGVLAAPNRFLPAPPIPGLSIILAPPTVGLAMEGIGRWFDARDRRRPPLTTFWGAAAFSLGMAATRFFILT